MERDEYDQITLLVINFLSNHDHVSEIAFGEVLDFADQIHTLLRELRKQK